MVLEWFLNSAHKVWRLQHELYCDAVFCNVSGLVVATSTDASALCPWFLLTRDSFPLPSSKMFGNNKSHFPDVLLAIHFFLQCIAGFSSWSINPGENFPYNMTTLSTGKPTHQFHTYHCLTAGFSSHRWDYKPCKGRWNFKIWSRWTLGGTWTLISPHGWIAIWWFRSGKWNHRISGISKDRWVMVGEVIRIVKKWQMLVLQEGSAAFQKNGWDICWSRIWPNTIKKNILVGVS